MAADEDASGKVAAEYVDIKLTGITAILQCVNSD